MFISFCDFKVLKFVSRVDIMQIHFNLCSCINALFGRISVNKTQRLFLAHFGKQGVGENGASSNTFYSNPCSVKSVKYLKLFISLGNLLVALGTFLN